MKLYGLGRRGLALLPPGFDDPFGPIPLYETPEPIQAIIDAQNDSSFHVIEYVVIRRDA